jgi:hypothetical protein
MEYIQAAHHDQVECFLCAEPAANEDDRYFILARTPRWGRAFAVNVP